VSEFAVYHGKSKMRLPGYQNSCRQKLREQRYDWGIRTGYNKGGNAASTKQETVVHPMQSYIDEAVKESMKGQVNKKSPVSCGFVYAGWIEHYGMGLHTGGQAQNLKRRKGNHQRDCPFRDFHYLPTCTLFVYNMDKAEKALLRHFRSKFKPSHEKGDWFYCTRAEAIAAFHEFVQLYHLEEEANECHR
jgi:hypothetical protein